MNPSNFLQQCIITLIVSHLYLGFFNGYFSCIVFCYNAGSTPIFFPFKLSFLINPVFESYSSHMVLIRRNKRFLSRSILSSNVGLRILFSNTFRCSSLKIKIHYSIDDEISLRGDCKPHNGKLVNF